MTKFLHTMIRVSDPDATLALFALIGVTEVRRFDNAAGRFTLIFLAAPGEEGVAEVELTYNWPPDEGEAEVYGGGRNFGHLAYRVEKLLNEPARLQSLRENALRLGRPDAARTVLDIILSSDRGRANRAI